MADNVPVPPDKQSVHLIFLICVRQKLENAIVETLGIGDGIGPSECCRR
jgi:hypothetical protein